MENSSSNIKKSSSKIEKEEDDPPDSLTVRKKIFQKELIDKTGSFFVGKSQEITIKSNFSQKGIRLEVGDVPFEIIYPENYWLKFPNFFKKILSENLAFASTFHLPYLLNINSLNYRMPRPITESLFFKGFVLSLPSIALMKVKTGGKTSDLLKKFFAINFRFDGESNVSTPNSLGRQITKTAVLPFTFGKDSLLTYSLCKELGIKSIPVFVKEPLPESRQENYHKEKSAKEFLKEFKEKVIFLDNEAGKLREDGGWYGWELQLTQYALLMLPIVFANKSHYLFFSNEQSCNEEFLDEEGFWCNPVFEQSAEWLMKINKVIKEMGVENLRVSSLIEPLHELAIVKVLHSRYPEIAKYQSSCFAEKPEAKFNRWCGNCSKCARIYIFFLANNINPAKIGIQTNMLESKYKTKFSLFENGNIKDSEYDQSRLGRDEQLLAFLLAYRNGHKGELMDLFKSLYLKEAEKREKELRKKYFGIHSTKTIPEELKDKVLKIYREELKDLK